MKISEVSSPNELEMATEEIIDYVRSLCSHTAHIPSVGWANMSTSWNRRHAQVSASTLDPTTLGPWPGCYCPNRTHKQELLGVCNEAGGPRRRDWCPL